MSEIKLHEFANKNALADSLAEKVSNQLREQINGNDQALLALSGGSTPKIFLNKLSTKSVDWKKVTVTLVDERWVGEDSERSNARLIKENLLIGEAKCADFMPLYHEEMDIDQTVLSLEQRFTKLVNPITCAILGMGLDGHTASFFPDSDNLPQAINPQTKQTFIAINAPNAGEPRITFTLPPLVNAKHRVLHIEGQDKMDVLKTALQNGPVKDLPIRSILNSKKPIDVYFCTA